MLQPICSYSFTLNLPLQNVDFASSSQHTIYIYGPQIEFHTYLKIENWVIDDILESWELQH